MSEEPSVGTIIERPDGSLWIHEPPNSEDMRPDGSGGVVLRDRSWFRLDLANDDPETWVKIQASAVVVRRGGKSFTDD